MPAKLNLLGQRFGRLVVIASAAADGKNTNWLCHCTCGRECVVHTRALTHDGTTSCGCRLKEIHDSIGERSSLPFNDHEFLDDSTVAIQITDRHGNLVGRALIDASDLPVVSQHRWHARVGASGVIYAVTNVKAHVRGAPGAQIKMHRLIMAEELSSSPSSEIDHVSRDGLDNRRLNLRLATRAENISNRRVRRVGKSGFVGVYRKGSRWCAKASKKYLGSFATCEEAARAYDVAVRVQHGEFAAVNFPEAGERSIRRSQCD